LEARKLLSHTGQITVSPSLFRAPNMRKGLPPTFDSLPTETDYLAAQEKAKSEAAAERE
jgi:hypothetical protein